MAHVKSCKSSLIHVTIYCFSREHLCWCNNRYDTYRIKNLPENGVNKLGACWGISCLWNWKIVYDSLKSWACPTFLTMTIMRFLRTKEVDVIIHLILHQSYVAIHIQQGIFAIASGILLAKFHFDFSLSYKNLDLEIRTPWRCSIIIFSPLQLPSSMLFKEAHQIFFSFSSCLVMGNLEFPFWINRRIEIYSDSLIWWMMCYD